MDKALYYSEDALQELSKISDRVRKELRLKAIELVERKHRDTITEKDIKKIAKEVLERIAVNR